MLSEEEKKAINNLNFIVATDIYDNEVSINKTEMVNEYNHSVGIVLSIITKLQKKLNKKDKQIDLMARAFKQDDVRTVEEIKQYFEREVKDGG